MTGARKRTRRPKHTQRSLNVYAGSPSRREPGGDGVPIVRQILKVTPETGRRGTGRGIITREGAGRGMRKSCSMLKEPGTDTGEPVAVKAARRVGAVRRVVISLLEAGGIEEVFLGYRHTWPRKPKGTKHVEEAVHAPKRCRAGYS